MPERGKPLPFLVQEVTVSKTFVDSKAPPQSRLAGFYTERRVSSCPPALTEEKCRRIGEVPPSAAAARPERSVAWKPSLAGSRMAWTAKLKDPAKAKPVLEQKHADASWRPQLTPMQLPPMQIAHQPSLVRPASARGLIEKPRRAQLQESLGQLSEEETSTSPERLASPCRWRMASELMLPTPESSPRLLPAGAPAAPDGQVPRPPPFAPSVVLPKELAPTEVQIPKHRKEHLSSLPTWVPTAEAAEATLPPPPAEQAPPPTIGSIGHWAGACRPCAFMTKGCSSGSSCPFCHLCDPSERLRRKRIRKKAYKMGLPVCEYTGMPLTEAHVALMQSTMQLSEEEQWMLHFAAFAYDAQDAVAE